MSRREEVLLLILTGVLLAFGIDGDGRNRREPCSFKEEMDQSAIEIAGYWSQTGGYIKEASEQYGRDPERAA